MTRDNKLYRGITISPNTFETIDNIHKEVQDMVNSSAEKVAQYKTITKESDNSKEGDQSPEAFGIIDELNKELNKPYYQENSGIKDKIDSQSKNLINLIY